MNDDCNTVWVNKFRTISQKSHLHNKILFLYKKFDGVVTLFYCIQISWK